MSLALTLSKEMQYDVSASRADALQVMYNLRALEKQKSGGTAARNLVDIEKAIYQLENGLDLEKVIYDTGKRCATAPCPGVYQTFPALDYIPHSIQPAGSAPTAALPIVPLIIGAAALMMLA